MKKKVKRGFWLKLAEIPVLGKKLVSFLESAVSIQGGKCHPMVTTEEPAFINHDFQRKERLILSWSMCRGVGVDKIFRHFRCDFRNQHARIHKRRVYGLLHHWHLDQSNPSPQLLCSFTVYAVIVTHGDAVCMCMAGCRDQGRLRSFQVTCEYCFSPMFSMVTLPNVEK